MSMMMKDIVSRVLEVPGVISAKVRTDGEDAPFEISAICSNRRMGSNEIRDHLEHHIPRYIPFTVTVEYTDRKMAEVQFKNSYQSFPVTMDSIQDAVNYSYMVSEREKATKSWEDRKYQLDLERQAEILRRDQAYQRFAMPDSMLKTPFSSAPQLRTFAPSPEILALNAKNAAELKTKLRAEKVRQLESGPSAVALAPEYKRPHQVYCQSQYDPDEP
jgi:hypothetical protein